MSKQRASQSFQISDGAHSRGRRMDQAVRVRFCLASPLSVGVITRRLVAAAVGLHKHARHVHASRAHSYAILGRALLRRLEGFEQVHHIAHFPMVIGPIASHEDYEIAP